MNLQTAIGPVNRIGCRVSRYTNYSHSNRITMHQQLCMLVDGTVHIYNLKLFLKKNKQYARTVGLPKNRTFVKDGKLWRQVFK